MAYWIIETRGPIELDAADRDSFAVRCQATYDETFIRFVRPVPADDDGALDVCPICNNVKLEP